MTLRLFVSAGEASGDAHAAAVVRSLKTRVPEVEVRGLGGPALEAEGAHLLAGLDELSTLGFSEVARRFLFFVGLMRRALREIETWNPDLVLAVDYPGFNLRLARKVRSRGRRVVYYIAPQVWAWRRERRPGIARAVDHLLVVFPFEERLFQEFGIRTTFVGHPLLDRMAAEENAPDPRVKLGLDSSRPLLALLPGSRSQEIEAILPALVAGTRELAEARGVQRVVSRAPGIQDHRYAAARDAGCVLWPGSAGALIRTADAALVASGTATLETGLLGTPLAVVYRTGWLNWHLARALIRLRTVGLVNIAAGGSRVPELLQENLNPERVHETASRLLFDAKERAEQKRYLAGLGASLGGPGAAERVAEAVLELGRA